MPGFHLISSNRLETLARTLAALMRDNPLPPLTPETVVVQSRGMQRYVSIQLAQSLGACANVWYPFPNALIDSLFKRFFDYVPDRSPFERETLAWIILDLLESCRDMPAFAQVNAYSAEDPHGIKRYQLAAQIADLFDQYAAFRPDMIAAWSRGEYGEDPDEQWQATLWRTIRERVRFPHRVALHQRLLEAIAKGAIPDSLPPRISIFGVSSLPRLHLDILNALSAVIDIYLFFMNPTEHFWDDIRSERTISRLSLQKGPDAPEKLHLETAHPLLAAFGDHGREFLTLLHGIGCDEQGLFTPPEQATLLGRIQADIFRLDAPDDKPRIPADDVSLQIHACHSPLREVETLRDVLLDLLERFPDLRPHDIVVMTPDIETYGPYIQAVFDAPGDERTRIPYSIADRSARGESRIADDFLRLLDLPRQRFAADQVCALLESPFVQARAGLDDHDVATVREWIEQVRIRWGIDADSRAAEGLPATPENTWRAGLNRLLLGFAMEQQDLRLVEGVLPAACGGGEDARILGALITLMEHLFDAADTLARPRPLQEWATLLDSLFDRFFVSEQTNTAESAFVRTQIAMLAQQASLSAFSHPVSPAVIRYRLGVALANPSFGSGFLAGGVTFCAMLPMRGVPFEAVCLLGMHDRAFPRQEMRREFSLLTKRPRPGDRNTRKDDTYIFLEALLSARRLLSISYVGQSADDNTPRPPSVLVSELLDYGDRLYAGAEGGALSPQLLRRHRLQPFSRAYFDKGSNLFSFNDIHCQAARALTSKPRAFGPFLETPLPPPAEAEVCFLSVDQLCSFFGNPARAFLRQRLGVSLRQARTPVACEENFSLVSLDRYHLEQLLLEQALKGGLPAWSLDAAKQMGVLPHGTAGETAFAALSGTIRRTAQTLLALGKPADPPWLDLDLALDNCRIAGRVRHMIGQTLVRCRHARISARDRLEIWLLHLAVCAMYPDKTAQTSVLVGVDRRRTPSHDKPERERMIHYRFVPHARELLDRYLAWYREGLCRPLRFFPASSLAYAEAVVVKEKDHQRARLAAAREWEPQWQRPGECEDSWNQLCWEHDAPLDEEFGDMALAVFEPLLACEREISTAPAEADA